MAELSAGVARHPCALPPGRTFHGASDKDGIVVKAAVDAALRDNASFKIKSGPAASFHNHNAAWLIAVFRMGCTEEVIADIMRPDATASIEGGEAQGDFVVTSDNWLDHLGAGVGLYGIGAHRNYQAYRVFFQAEIERSSAEDVLRAYFPRLAPGLLGDFFHAVIELGYYFESREPSLLPNALAWLSVAYVELPANDRAVPPLAVSAEVALQAAAAEAGCFPIWDLRDGASGYIGALETLFSQYDLLDTALSFDVAIPAGQTRRVLDEIQVAARSSFVAGGSEDFYTLHSVTGSRAVWAILTGMQWPEEVERLVLGTLWKGVLFTHIVRGNCPLLPLLESRQFSSDSCRPWEEIHAWAIGTKNSHVIKVCFTYSAFYDSTSDIGFWLAADLMMAKHQHGVQLVGGGTGPTVDVYAARHEAAIAANLAAL